MTTEVAVHDEALEQDPAQVADWFVPVVIVVALVSVRAVGGPFREMRPYADLFFMGTAFLLLETKNVASFALMFGTTWLVNALVEATPISGPACV